MSKSVKFEDTKFEALNKVDVDRDRPYRTYAAISFAVVMMIIGLPLWWKTTQVYRASLPSSEIGYLADSQLIIPAKIKILWSTSETESAAVSLSSVIVPILSKVVIHPKLTFKFSVETSGLSLEDRRALDSAQTLADLDKVGEEDTNELLKYLTFNFVLIPSEWAVSQDFRAYLAKGNRIFVNLAAPRELAQVIEELLFDISLDTRQLLNVVQRNMKERPHPATFQKESRQQDVWSVSVQPRHSVDLYLVNPDPASCSTRSFDFADFAGPVFGRLANILEPITELVVKTEILYGVKLAYIPEFDTQGNKWTISEKKLPLVVNPLEPHITTLEPGTPVYRLLVYISPPETNPLYLIDESGQLSDHNSFVVAGWGGLVIENPSNKCNETIEKIPKQVLEALVGQFRVLVGLATLDFPPDMVKTTDPVASWELRRLAVRTLVDNTLTSITTLQSLTELLYDIGNIVISDEVALEIDTSVKSLQKVMHALHTGDVGSALEHSRMALKRSENAFFDPSLLALLYFPDDQKYAIYIPLFLPVGVPVVLSLKRVLGFFKKK